jgi:6-phosphogluconolactonase
MPINQDQVVVSENVSQTVKALIETILNSLELLSSQRSFITIGLSGGSLINQLSDEILNYLDRFKPYTQKLKFLFCDERFVPLDHKDSTYYGYKVNKFFEHLQIPGENVYNIKADSPSVEECAVDYEKRLRPLLNENQGFDILLLGIGLF